MLLAFDVDVHSIMVFSVYPVAAVAWICESVLDEPSQWKYREGPICVLCSVSKLATCRLHAVTAPTTCSNHSNLLVLGILVPSSSHMRRYRAVRGGGPEEGYLS
jgi:hypothetical protein